MNLKQCHYWAILSSFAENIFEVALLANWSFLLPVSSMKLIKPADSQRRKSSGCHTILSGEYVLTPATAMISYIAHLCLTTFQCCIQLCPSIISTKSLPPCRSNVSTEIFVLAYWLLQEVENLEFSEDFIFMYQFWSLWAISHSTVSRNGGPLSAVNILSCFLYAVLHY